MKCWQATGPRFSNGIVRKRTAQPTAGCLLFTLAVLACCAQPARAAHIVHSYFLIDASTGRVLESFHANRRAHPASLTKLMTLYLTFQRLDSGHLTLGTPLRVSRHAATREPAKLFLRPGTHITVREAILAITTRSANDAAVVLAEGIGGSEARFARMMNHEARLLGMTRTSFYNASGLPNSRQWTTARDMATLAVALIHTYPQYYHFFSVRAFRFHGRTIWGHDHLLGKCDGVDGMKTGYINASGYNLVTSALRGDRRLVGVVLGGHTATARDLQMIGLINHGFKLSPAARVEEASSEAPPVPVHGARAVERRVSTVDDDAVPSDPDWIIEIGGSVHTQHAVRRILHSARLTAPSPLHHGRGLVVRLRHRRYRARFSQLSRAEALRACSALRHRDFTCRILTPIPPPTQDIASAAGLTAGQSE